MLNLLLDNLALLYAVLFLPAPLFWMVIHPNVQFWRRWGSRSLAWVAIPLWTACALLLAAERSRIYATRFEYPAARWAGALLVLISLWIGYLVHRDFGWRRLAGLPELNPGSYRGSVVEHGIYAYVRHPRYVEYMTAFFGFGLLTGALGIFSMAIGTVLMYLFVAPIEERELHQFYGLAYAEYARRVPRFVPRWRTAPARHENRSGAQ